MRRGSSAMLTAALGLWLWLACGGRNLEGLAGDEGPSPSSGGANGTTTTTATSTSGATVTNGVVTGGGVTGGVVTGGVVTTGGVTGGVTTLGTTTGAATTGFVTTGNTTGATSTGAGGTSPTMLPDYVLMGAPLAFAPTATSFGLSVVLSHGDPRNLEAYVFDDASDAWQELDNPDFPTSDSVRFEADGLEPGRRYAYQVRVPDTINGDQDPLILYEGSVVTQRPPAEPFSFLLLTDSHIPPHELAPGETSLVYYSEQMLSLVVSGIMPGADDFMMTLGDTLDFHDFGFNDPPPDGSYTRLGYLNYRRLLGDLLGNASHFQVIGNWDGENGTYTAEQIAYSREQRLDYVPGPTPDTYPEGGSAGEDYYAFTWGDALFVVLNVMTYTPTPHLLSYDPGVADDWTLGDEQMEFLSTTLAEATSKWKFLFIHHTVGGAAGDQQNSAYGRGGGQAANVGEQAVVHQLMRDYGVQIFFYGHDHVFTDMVVDDIHYTLPGSAGAEWKFAGNETGYSDYWVDSGHGRVRVSSDAVTVDFVNFEGNVIYSYTLE